MARRILQDLDPVRTNCVSGQDGVCENFKSFGTSGSFAGDLGVVLPILKRNIVAVWLLVFIAASREVSSALFLYGPRTRTMSVMFFDLTEGADFEQLAALGLIMAVMTMLFVAIGQFVAGRDFMLRRE